MNFTNIHKAGNRIDKLLAYPGISKEDFIQRKRYWLATVACFVVIAALVAGFWIFHPEFKILLSYGLFLAVFYLEFIIANLMIRRDLRKLMFFNEIVQILATFVCVLMLGGIMHSGGLIFIGFFTVLFSLDIQGRKNLLWLFGIFVTTLILAALLQPRLTVAPEMTPRANLTLFVVNLLWISAFAFVFVLNFVTEKVDIEKRETDRLTAWDKTKTGFYTNITHEFRTPLTVIRGMTDLVRDKPEKWLYKGTRKIDNNAGILLNLVNQMLDLSKLEAGAMPVRMIRSNIGVYIKYLVESFHSLADCKKVRLRYLPEHENLVMDYDPEKMMLIITNLVANAIKYSRPGGRVEIKSSLTGETGRELEIRVKDNGAGIPEGHLQHIFDRFYRVESGSNQIPGASGSGLGLAITKEVVILMGGMINVKSIHKKGTEFIVLLPVTDHAPLIDDDVVREKIETPAVSYPEGMPVIRDKEENNKPLLLIVEDSYEVVEYLMNLLEPDFRIRIAPNGKEGLDKTLKLGPDIILSDIMMPEMDGIELLDRVKNDMRTSHIPLVILSAKADIASRLAGLNRGADVYMAKPFNPKELTVQLQRLLQEREKLRKRYSNIGGLIPGSKNNDFKLEDSFMKKVNEYLLANLGKDTFKINELCHEAAMSRSQLYRKFKTLTDKTIFDYFRSLRLHRAREILMASGTVSVSDAAFQTGFKSASHFSRAFTKEFGISPGKIRE